MSDPRSFERLRQAALSMLDDGNSVESVAHVLEVSVDVVAAWRAHPQAAAPASAFADTEPPPDEPPPAPPPAGDARARVRFNDELVYASSIAMRTTGMVSGIVLAVLIVGIVFTLLRGASHDIGHVAGLLARLIVLALAARMMLGWARRILVLGTDSVIVPRVFGHQAMAYSDVAGYDLRPHTMRLDAQSQFKGRLLSVRSRRPGVEPLSVFLFDDYPVDQRILERLDEVTRANVGAPALPPLVGGVARRSVAPGGPVLVFAMLVLLGALQLWPVFSDSVHTLWRGVPALASLRHVEGRVAGASDCWTRSKGNGGASVMTLAIAQPAARQEVIVPCLLDHDLLVRRGVHAVAVDLDPDARPVPLVWQMSLDGRVVLAYEAVKARQHRLDFVPSVVGVALPLAAFGLMLFVLRTSWMRSKGRVVDA